MSYELLYTSSKKGLKPAAAGFCTVMMTEGLSQPLMDRLELLSGYRHAFMPGTPQHALNPVAYSHIRVTEAGRNVHILSRIADAGLDYSKRTNKLAYHLVLEPHERPAGGPAWLLAQPNLMQTTWDQQVMLRRTGKSIPTGDPPIGPAHRWKELTGDAGWAGVLAQSVHSDPTAVVVLVFAPGQELLPLFAEAIAVLPSSRRWDATFTTYATGLPGDVRCAWRGVLKGSPEEAAARQSRTTKVLDLTQPLGAPPPGRFVEAARTGVVAAEGPGEAPPSLPPALDGGRPKSLADVDTRSEASRLLRESEPQPASRSRMPVSTRPPARLGDPPAVELPPELPPVLAPPPQPAPAEFSLPVSKEVIALALTLLVALAGVIYVKFNDWRDEQGAPQRGGGGRVTTVDRNDNPAPQQPDGSTGEPQPGTLRPDPVQVPTAAANNTPERIEHQIRLPEGGKQTFTEKHFVDAFRRKVPDAPPLKLKRIDLSNVESSDQTLVTATIDAAGTQAELSAARLPPERLREKQIVVFNVQFEDIGQRQFWLTVEVLRTRFRLRLDEGTLAKAPHEVAPDDFRTAEFRPDEMLNPRKFEWHGDRGELECEFEPSRVPTSAFPVRAEFVRRDQRFRAEFAASLERERLSLTKLDRLETEPPTPTPAPDRGAVPIAKALQSGRCAVTFHDLTQAPASVRQVESFVGDGEVEGSEARVASFAAPLGRVQFGLFKPEGNLQLQPDRDRDACRIINPSSPLVPTLGRFQLAGGGTQLLFTSPLKDLSQLPTLPECALRVSGASDHLLVLTAPYVEPRATTITRDAAVKDSTVTLSTDLFQRVRGVSVWRLLLLDPRSEKEAKWLPLTQEGGKYLYQYKSDRKPDENEVCLEHITFTLSPNLEATPAEVRFKADYSKDWAAPGFREKLATDLALANEAGSSPERVKQLTAQRDLLQVLHPRPRDKDDRPPPYAFRVCALGYSRLSGPASPAAAGGPTQSILVLRTAIGMSLKDLQGLGGDHLVAVDGTASN